MTTRAKGQGQKVGLKGRVETDVWTEAIALPPVVTRSVVMPFYRPHWVKIIEIFWYHNLTRFLGYYVALFV